MSRTVRSSQKHPLASLSAKISLIKHSLAEHDLIDQLNGSSVRPFLEMRRHSHTSSSGDTWKTYNIYVVNVATSVQLSTTPSTGPISSRLTLRSYRWSLIKNKKKIRKLQYQMRSMQFPMAMVKRVFWDWALALNYHPWSLGLATQDKGMISVGGEVHLFQPEVELSIAFTSWQVSNDRLWSMVNSRHHCKWDLWQQLPGFNNFTRFFIPRPTALDLWPDLWFWIKRATGVSMTSPNVPIRTRKDRVQMSRRVGFPI